MGEEQVNAEKKPLEGILSIAGKPGLYKLVSQSRNGILVESITDGKRMHVSASQQVSALAEIAIYTTDEEMPLTQVFAKMAAAGALPDAKSSPEALRAFMEQALPEYDRERVYPSHIQKVVNWYRILSENNLLGAGE
jgi:hypothetical protein